MPQNHSVAKLCGVVALTGSPHNWQVRRPAWFMRKVGTRLDPIAATEEAALGPKRRVTGVQATDVCRDTSSVRACRT